MVAKARMEIYSEGGSVRDDEEDRRTATNGGAAIHVARCRK